MYYIYINNTLLFLILIFIRIFSFSTTLNIQDINQNFCLEAKTGTKECKICKPGYILTTNNECTLTKDCIKADLNTGICLECEKNSYFDLDTYQCIPYSENENSNLNFCLKVFQNKCIECISSYYLSLDNKCVSTKNCKLSKNGICVECIQNFFLSLNDKKCTNTHNCLVVNPDWECDKCQEDYYYNISKHKCLKKDNKNSNLINCKKVLTKNNCNKCNECDTNYYLNLTDLLCYKNTENNKFFKCAKSDIFGLNCEKCITGYYLSSKNKKCSQIYGCTLFENDKCISCENNLCHDLKNNLCFPMNIENNYNNNTIKEYNKFCINCYETNAEGTGCQKCKEGYFVGENGVCITTYNCEEAYNGICYKCKDNYCLNEEKSCNLTEINNCLKCENLNLYNSKCTECNQGFGLNENNICYKCDIGCKKCSSKNNNCLECFEGFYLEQINEKEKDLFTCKQCNESCKKCLNENECLTCADNYYEEKDENDEIKCIKCPEGCDDCNNKLNCVKCKSDYKLINVNGESFCIRTKKVENLDIFNI